MAKTPAKITLAMKAAAERNLDASVVKGMLVLLLQLYAGSRTDDTPRMAIDASLS
jgi:hypothetical protein